MTTRTDIEFRNGENWRILFVAHYDDGSVMPLDDASISFRLTAVDGEEYAIEKTTGGNGIVITDAAAGAARIDISTSDQQQAAITPETGYTFEILVVKGTDSSVQAEGRFVVRGSLFGPAVSLLLRVFRFRFPEIVEDDATVMMHLRDAQLTIIQDIGWNALDVEAGTVYLAAHNIMMRKNSSQQYITGGAEASGAIRTISIEDRSVSFGNTSSNSTNSGGGVRLGYAETAYGRHFLMLSRRQVRFVLRA